MPSLLNLARSPITWAVIAVLLFTGLLTQHRRAVSAERQAAFMAQGLKTAYEHPAQKVETATKRTIRSGGFAVVKGSGTATVKASGETEIKFNGELTLGTSTQTSEEVHTSSATTPVLPPAGVRLPTRLIWVGWSIPERIPAMGASLRLLGPVWVGAWIRGATSSAPWDVGPTLLMTF